MTALRAWLDAHGRDLAALLLRVGLGGFMALNHGWGKLLKFPEKYATFSDPLHITPPLSMASAIFGELVCPTLLVLGLFVRPAAVPAVFTMLVAALLVHKSDVLGDGEHALLFAIGFGAIGLMGGGRYSLDALRARKRAH